MHLIKSGNWSILDKHIGWIIHKGVSAMQITAVSLLCLSCTLCVNALLISCTDQQII